MAGGTVKVLDPTTGKVEDLPAADAQESWVSGKRQLLDGDQIPLVGPDGKTVMQATPDRVQKALDAGWRFADRQQIATHDAEGQKLQAFVEGAGSQLSLGASDLVARQAGMDPVELKARRESTSGGMGSATGLAASLFVPGLGEAAAAERVGATAAKGLARTAIDAALTPMAAVTHVGNLIEKQAGDALGRVIESQAAARIAGSAVGRGVEGAIYGAGGALSEESLGNPDMNAQSLLAALGGGALMGLGVGGIAGGAFRGLAEGGNAAGRGIKNTVTGGLEKLGKRFAATPTEASAALAASGIDIPAENGVLQKFLKTFTEDAPEAVGIYPMEHVRAVNTPKAQAWFREGDAAIDASVRDLRGVFDQMSAEQQAAGKQAYQNLKPKVLDETLPKNAGNATMAEMARTTDAVRAKLQYIAENPAEFGLGEKEGRSVVERYLYNLDELENQAFKRSNVPREIKETITTQVSPEIPASRKVVKAASQETIPAAENYVMREVQNARAPMGADDLIAAIKAVNKEITPGEVKRAIDALQEQGHLAFEGDGKKRLINLTESGAEHTPQNVRDIPEVTKDIPGTPAVTRAEEATRQKSLAELADKYPVTDDVIRDTYNRLNKFKALLDAPGKFNEEVSTAGQRAIRDSFREARDVLRTHLEDQAVYGKAGQLQSELNSANFARQRAWDRLREETPLKFFDDGKIDGASLLSYAKGLEKVRGDHVAQLLEDWTNANHSFAETAARNFGAEGSDMLARAKNLRAEYGKVQTVLGEKVAAFNSLKTLQNRRTAVMGSMGGGIAQGIVGGALGSVFGLPAIAATALALPIIDPGRAALLRANTAGLVSRTREWITKQAEALVSGVKAKIEHLPKLPSVNPSAAVSKATLQMLEAKTPEERLKAYNTRLDELQTLRDPQAYGDHSAQAMAGFRDALPAHAEAMDRTTQIALGLLGASIPRVRAASMGTGLLDSMHMEPKPHDRDVLKFAQVDRMLQNPAQTIFDRAASGGFLFRHEMEAVEKAYPGLLDQIRESVMAAGHRSTKRISHSTSRVLGQIMGGPGASYNKISTYQSVHAAAKQQAAAQQPKGPGSSGAKSDRVKALASPTDRLDNYPTV